MTVEMQEEGTQMGDTGVVEALAVQAVAGTETARHVMVAATAQTEVVGAINLVGPTHMPSRMIGRTKWRM